MAGYVLIAGMGEEVSGKAMSAVGAGHSLRAFLEELPEGQTVVEGQEESVPPLGV